MPVLCVCVRVWIFMKHPILQMTPRKQKGSGVVQSVNTMILPHIALDTGSTSLLENAKQ